MNFASRSVVSLAGVAAATLAYGSVVERNAFTVRRVEVPVLPAGAAPFTVLHLSDLHLMPCQRRKVRWVRNLARLEPDLVVNTGDNLAHPDAVGPLLSALEPFLDMPGAFVLGSNDYVAPSGVRPWGYLTGRPAVPRGSALPTEELVLGLGEHGWRDLSNARDRLDVAGVDVEVVGVNDPHLGLDRYEEVAGPADPAATVTIGLTHAPYRRVLDAMAADGVDLILAGHTHGGQVAVPGVGALVTNCDLDRRRARGLSRWWPGASGAPSGQAPAGASWLHVSAGLGTSPYAPVRFAARPEAVMLALVPSTRAPR